MTLPLAALTRWYTADRDGAWEHHNGISIRSTDNPGWWVTINLEARRWNIGCSRRSPKASTPTDTRRPNAGCIARSERERGTAPAMKHGSTKILRRFLDWASDRKS